jgi:carboxylesterase type B
MTSAQTIVHTASGDISGTVAASGVRAYRGIPYAAPPVGPLRWRPPQPAIPWTGVHDGSRFGFDPIQLNEPAERGSQAPGMSEDCLTLNVWAPAVVPAGGAPVLVWFDGGGFTADSGAKVRTDGEKFARRGAVLVTVNYRVGVFGFLAHPALTAESPQHASGNYGFLDAIASLQWVRDNIAAFGGDPKRITAFGESAGGAVVAALLISPLARGTFDQVILQSPGSFRSLSPLADAETAGLVAGSDLTAMRAMTAAELLPLNAKINPAVRGLTIPRPLRTIIDGWSIDRDEVDAFRTGTFAHVPAIVGSNAYEGGWFTANIPVRSIEKLRAYVTDNYGDMVEEAWTHYGADSDDAVERAVGDAFGDAQFSYGARSLAKEISKRQPKTFRYLFTHAGAHTSNPPVHSDDVIYVFGNGTFDADDQRVSDAMMAAWVQFAATGDPNGPGVPAWAPYDAGRDNYLTFGGDMTEGSGWRTKSLDFIERFYAART